MTISEIMNLSKKLAIAIMLIAGFIFAVSFSTLYAQTHIVEGTACYCTLPIPLLIPTFSSLGILVGSFVYYLMFSKLRESEVKSVKDARILIDMLQHDEKKIIEKIIENKGEVTQSKLSSVFGKVKTFRILENLKRRGIISKETYGKTNKIKLDEKFREILFP